MVTDRPGVTNGPYTVAPGHLQVETGVRRKEAEQGNIAWLTAVRRARPYVTWKFAATLDGRSAAADRRRISGVRMSQKPHASSRSIEMVSLPPMV